MFPRIFVEAIIFAVLSSAILVAEPALKLLAFYSTNVESDHAKTANNAIAFYRDLAAENNFVFDVTMDGGKLNDPLAQRLPGFHVAGYFLGGAVFCSNNWPLLPAKLMVDDPNSPPRAFLLHLYHRRTNGICGNRAHA